MNELTLVILKIVISVAVTLVTTFIIPAFRSYMKANQMEEVLTIIDTAVQAAEQTIKDGSVKKADVLQFMSNWLDKKGIKISDAELDRLIESAVFAMNSAIKPVS